MRAFVRWPACARTPRSSSPVCSLQAQGKPICSCIAFPSFASATPSVNFGFLPSFTCATQKASSIIVILDYGWNKALRMPRLYIQHQYDSCAAAELAAQTSGPFGGCTIAASMPTLGLTMII
jgi:hypothetical protein